MCSLLQRGLVRFAEDLYYRYEGGALAEDSVH